MVLTISDFFFFWYIIVKIFSYRIFRDAACYLANRLRVEYSEYCNGELEYTHDVILPTFSLLRVSEAADL